MRYLGIHITVTSQDLTRSNVRPSRVFSHYSITSYSLLRTSSALPSSILLPQNLTHHPHSTMTVVPTTSSGPLSPIRNIFRDIHSTVKTYRPELLTSATARLISILVLNPLDAAKSRLQVSTASSPLALRAVRSGNPLAIDSVRSGGASPFAGVFAAMLAHSPGSVLAFVAYASLKSRFSALSAAAAADAMVALWLAPFEAAKLRVQTGMAENLMGGLGKGGVFMGLGAQIVRDVPFRLMHLIAYDRVSSWWKNRKGREVGVRDGAALGAVIGAVVGGITTPLDVIKTRVMSQMPGPGKAYEGWVACARRTVTIEGVGGMFRGVGQRVVYMAASVALFSAAYEVTKKSWHKVEEKVEEKLGKNDVFVDAPPRA